ncbi:MAG: DNA gyrase inhibitor YacG [Saccharospirillum sp.]|nr:DNA gyrase inhibitor YacG [Saccharospirillum sp.]
MSSATRVPCPTCKKAVVYSTKNPFRPFCSERCKLIDLGEWASEGHRIAGKPAVDEMMSGDLEGLGSPEE